MSRSTQQLKYEFKLRLETWSLSDQSQGLDGSIIAEIQKWGVYLENFFQEKVALLSADFNDHKLSGEYLRSVTEGFEDLDRIMRTHKTIIDIVTESKKETLIKDLKTHYTRYLVPLLNIMAKLENDYVAIATNAILEKGRSIEKLEEDLQVLQKERKEIKTNYLELDSQDKYQEISKKIKTMELQKRLMRLTLHHDRLNLYYFNQDRPVELKELKESVDKIREEIRTLEGVNDEA